MVNRYYRGKRARQYNERWRGYTEKTLSAAEAMIDDESLPQIAAQRQHPLRVLDVACGTGVLLQHLLERVPGIEASGIDASADMLAQAREALKQPSQSHQVRLEQVDLNQGGWAHLLDAPHTFDLITCTNVLHDIEDPVAFFAGLRELLAPGGQLVVEDFAPRRPIWLWAAFEGLLRRMEAAPVHALTLSEAQAYCEQAGWYVIAQKPFKINWFWHGWVLRAGRLVPVK